MHETLAGRASELLPGSAPCKFVFLFREMNVIVDVVYAEAMISAAA